MKRLRPLLTGVLLLLTWIAAQAQHSTTSVYLEETLEELSLYGEEADWEDELEQLEQLIQQKLMQLLLPLTKVLK